MVASQVANHAVSTLILRTPFHNLRVPLTPLNRPVLPGPICRSLEDVPWAAGCFSKASLEVGRPGRFCPPRANLAGD